MRAKFFKLIRTIPSISFAFALTYGSVAFAYDPVDCLDDIAKSDPEIIVGLAARLCSGAWTPEPVKCYQLVSTLDTSIPRGIAIDLCAGAVRTAPPVRSVPKRLSRALSRQARHEN